MCCLALYVPATIICVLCATVFVAYSFKCTNTIRICGQWLIIPFLRNGCSHCFQDIYNISLKLLLIVYSKLFSFFFFLNAEPTSDFQLSKSYFNWLITLWLICILIDNTFKLPQYWIAPLCLTTMVLSQKLLLNILYA